jgi:hypothetical protein
MRYLRAYTLIRSGGDCMEPLKDADDHALNAFTSLTNIDFR